MPLAEYEADVPDIAKVSELELPPAIGASLAAMASTVYPAPVQSRLSESEPLPVAAGVKEIDAELVCPDSITTLVDPVAITLFDASRPRALRLQVPTASPDRVNEPLAELVSMASLDEGPVPSRRYVLTPMLLGRMVLAFAVDEALSSSWPVAAFKARELVQEIAESERNTEKSVAIPVIVFILIEEPPRSVVQIATLPISNCL
jgi:hypothetical protein